MKNGIRNKVEDEAYNKAWVEGYSQGFKDGAIHTESKNKIGKYNWSSYCATVDNRNQCSEEHCTIFPICLFKTESKHKESWKDTAY